MHTIRTLHPNENPLDPAFRVINFADEAAIVTVVTHCRALWVTDPAAENPTATQPVSNPDPLGLGSRLQLNKAQDAYEDAPVNPNKDDIDTPWRKAIHKTFCHVFYDVMRFLPEVNCRVGHYHPPTHNVIALPFVHEQPAPSEATAEQTGNSTPPAAAPVLCKEFPVNMLLIPVFLAPGVRIRAMARDTPGAPDEERELGTFDCQNSHEIWYLRRNVTFSLYVEGEHDVSSHGVAAVMAVGELCTEIHPGQEVCCQDGEDTHKC